MGGKQDKVTTPDSVKSICEIYGARKKKLCVVEGDHIDYRPAHAIDHAFDFASSIFLACKEVIRSEISMREEHPTMMRRPRDNPYMVGFSEQQRDPSIFSCYPF